MSKPTTKPAQRRLLTIKALREVIRTEPSLSASEQNLLRRLLAKQFREFRILSNGSHT